VPFMKECGKIL